MPKSHFFQLRRFALSSFGRQILLMLALSIPLRNGAICVAQESRLDSPLQIYRLGEQFKKTLGDRWLAAGPLDESFPMDDRKGSYVPALGEVAWELPEDVAKRVPFLARIYQISGNRQIGYVRFPNYDYDEAALKEFSSVIARFERQTVALVVDQVNNRGGSMFHMYGVLSFLADKALSVPKHQMTHTDEDAQMASEVVQRAEAGDTTISPEELSYAKFVISEKAAGRSRLTNPGYLAGIKEVIPSTNHYTKEIIVLDDELTMSAAEFFAAILQDGKRATIFGKQTAGAGGCAKRVLVGKGSPLEMILCITWTIAWRDNGQPIENVGISPDVRYERTREDLISGYSGYRSALLKVIDAKTLKRP